MFHKCRFTIIIVVYKYFEKSTPLTLRHLCYCTEQYTQKHITTNEVLLVFDLCANCYRWKWSVYRDLGVYQYQVARTEKWRQIFQGIFQPMTKFDILNTEFRNHIMNQYAVQANKKISLVWKLLYGIESTEEELALHRK